jgi:predicted transposase/invertase (TIGR01784 family)
MKYEKDLMASWDEYAIKKTIEHDRQMAREEGMKKGRQEGHAEGHAEGLEEGRQEGLEEGRQEGKTEVVMNLLATSRFSIAEIANFANVTESFVRKVKKEVK